MAAQDPGEVARLDDLLRGTAERNSSLTARMSSQFGGMYPSGLLVHKPKTGRLGNDSVPMYGGVGEVDHSMMTNLPQSWRHNIVNPQTGLQTTAIPFGGENLGLLFTRHQPWGV